MAYRALIVCMFAARLLSAADRATEIALANSLHDGDASAAEKLFDPKMKGFAHLRSNIEHLLAAGQADLHIDTATGVWSLDITARDLAAGVTHRHAKVSAPTQGGLIESLEPADFFAPPHGREAWDTLFAFAADLQNEDAAPRMDQFDRSMPGYEELKTAVKTLWTDWRIEPSLELTSNEGDDSHRTLQIEWTLTLNDSQDPGASAHREESVTCRIEKQSLGKQGAAWRIVSFTPASLFSPPKG
jgi:hypothetical protein